MRSITTFDLQYAHRFYGFQGEAQYLHGHTVSDCSTTSCAFDFSVGCTPL